MKPINLKLKGINSYVSMQEVKFDKLSENKLFGVFGETGSGKTTILDAIVLALYGQSDRENIANIINVNLNAAYIYFDFAESVDGEEKKFRVCREYALRSGVLKEKATLSNLVTGRIIAEGVEEVNSQILGIIGIDKHEFYRCIALPQGEFDRFLVDTKEGRKRTIAKIFNLEHFGTQLQDRVKSKKAMAELKLSSIQEKLALYEGVTQEALYSSHISLKTKQKRLKEIEKDLKTSEKKYDQLSSDYALSQQLIDNMAQLTVKNSEVSEILTLRKQIECTEKFGNLIVFVTKKQAYTDELNLLKPKLKLDQDELRLVTNKLMHAVDELGVLQDKRDVANAHLGELNSLLAEYNSKRDTLEQYANQYDKIESEANMLERSVEDLGARLVELNKSLDDQYDSRTKLNALIESNNKVLGIIHDSASVVAVDNFVEYLNYLKSLINTNDLQEVYQFNIYDEINNMLLSMQEYEMTRRKEVAGLKANYENLKKYNPNLSELQSSVELKNKQLQYSVARIDSGIEKSKELIVATKTQIEERTNLRKSKLGELKDINIKCIALEQELKLYDELEGLVAAQEEVDKLDNQIEALGHTIHQLTESKNNYVVAVEVSSAHIETLTRDLHDVIDTIRTLKINDEEYIDESFNLSPDELADAKERVNAYDSAVALLETGIKEIKSKIVNKNVTKVEVEVFANSIESLREEQARVNTEIGTLVEKIDKLKQDLVVVKDIQSQEKAIREEYQTVSKLNNLLSGGGLMDYVSEEYMVLVTEFANKYVYKISQGKFLLKYDGDFYVLDNFNGGARRSVKTLSGGERFIVSLSLALGISQSIAVNNNRAFNFFFIDEGFGSLSQDYIQNVIDSFNELIKLDFTVGFITHVERMQEFINNRIVVVKPNNEVGTQIHQFY